MINILTILLFITLYGLAMTGGSNGKRLFTAGLVIHAGYVLYRAWHLGWLPVTEKHDILLVMALIVALAYYYFIRKVNADTVLTILPVFIVILSFFGLFQVRMDSIDPNMNSIWFFVHIIFFVLGYAYFTISTVAGIIYVIKKDQRFELLQYRLALFGWLLFSFSLIGGSMWFYLSYGVYWLWTAKELWITIVWFYIGFYLHSRMWPSLMGRAASLIGLFSFPLIIFSYLGVMPIIGSPWSQF
jgi:ABC-type transport system involved in cytochrome c biogenesis permease subunit